MFSLLSTVSFVYFGSFFFFFFSSRRRHTRCLSDWSSDVCSSDLSRLASPCWYALSNASFPLAAGWFPDRKSTRLNSSHLGISYAVFCLKKKKNQENEIDIHNIKQYSTQIVKHQYAQLAVLL